MTQFCFNILGMNLFCMFGIGYEFGLIFDFTIIFRHPF